MVDKHRQSDENRSKYRKYENWMEEQVVFMAGAHGGGCGERTQGVVYTADSRFDEGGKIGYLFKYV